MGRVLFVGALVGLAASACRLNPECFGTNECRDTFICHQGRCTAPADIFGHDAGFPGRDAGPPVTYTWHRDVEPIVRRACLSCHSDPTQNFAPMALTTYAHTRAASPAGTSYSQLMGQRVTDSLRPMPPEGWPALTPLEISVIETWVREGAPEGDPGPPPDAGIRDAGFPDTGVADTGVHDAGFPDSGRPDTGPHNPLLNVTTLMAQPVAGGFQFTEGPTWDDARGVFLFSDIPASTIWEINNAGVTREFRRPSNQANGLAFDNQGRLLAAEHQARRVSRTLPGGAVEDLANNFEGNSFNSPNDLVARRSDNTIYFSDPDYGLEGRPREIPFNGLFRVTAKGDVFPEWQGKIGMTPNGVSLSPDERTLYLSLTAQDQVLAFDVAPDGSLSNERLFTDAIFPDGSKVDVWGNVYIATADGVLVLDPDGQLWGTIAVVGVPSNLAFGGPGRRVLFITNGQSVSRITMDIPGN